MAIPAVGFLVDAGILLFYILGWVVALGLLYTWNATFHHLFKGIADALSFTIHGPLGWSHTFHLGSWANSIDHTAQQFFSDWALGCEIIIGKTWHGMGDLFWAMSHAISDASSATLDFGHWLVHNYIPGAIDATLEPWLKKTNKAAAGAGAAGALAALLKRATRAENAAQSAATDAAKAEAHAAALAAGHAKSVATTVEHTIVHDTKVITQVVNVGELPTQFGRTVKQIRRRLGKVEALLGATAFAAAMANVLGIPSWRCLTKGPLGRTSRFLCGAPSWLLDFLLLGVVEGFIVSDLCGFTNLLIKQAEAIRPALLELVDVEDALIGCGGSVKPMNFALPPISLPAVVGISPLAA